MSLRNIGIVYRKELREALRDRRTVIASVVIPLILFPLLSVGFGSLVAGIVNKTEEASPKVMVVGGEDSPGVLAALKATPKVEIVPATPNWKDLVIDKEIPVAVEIPPGFDKSLTDQKKLEVTIYNYSGELKSEIAAGKVDKSLKTYRDDVVKNRVVAQKLPAEILAPFDVTQKNIAPPEKSGAALFFGGFIAYIVVFLCFNGGMHPAIDLTAGEKERGTMETILSSPISRAHLVFGKFMLVLTTALATAALSVISMGISFALVNAFHTQTIQAGKEGMEMHIGVGAALSVFIMAIPLAVLFSSILLMIASFAKTYKEAQTYIVPFMFFVIIPAIAAMLPGVDLNAKLALVPILNVSLLCKELVIGTYHWTLIAIIFISTCAYAAVALFLAVKMFQRESVLFRS
ncbi:MAG TPA: ABC transporter permease [Candidatus Dormibacteraeota bacterium]|jgi:sodium transport system permease protein|nr:ABC transporter permease [Candidatus Dormibacteraeota bacterium]